MPDRLPPHGLQHTRPPCPSLSHRVCSSSCPLNRWCHPTFSSSVALFSFCLQSFPVSESFPVAKVLELQYHLPVTTHGPVPNPLEVLRSPAGNINLNKYLLKEIPSQELRIPGKGLQHLGKAQRVKQVPDITLDPELVAQDQADSCRIIYQFSF